MKGIDISKHQGTVDFAMLKAVGVQFVIVRAGYGKFSTQKDPKFEEFYAGAKAVGLPVGAYWYSYATTEAEAKQEAAVCLEVINGKQFEFPVWFDQEYEPGIKAASKATRTACVKAFCDAMEAAGYYSGLYCSRDWLNNWLNNAALKKYDIWVAAYGSSPGEVALPYGMWQYSSTNGLNVPGFSGHLDCNEAYKDYPSVIKKAGLNGYGKATENYMIFSGRNKIPYTYGRYGFTRGNGTVWHGGVDIVGVDSDVVRMPWYNGKSISGTVVRSRIVTDKSNRTWEWGYYVCVKLDDAQTPDAVNYLYFCHCDKLLVNVGDKVQSGDALAIMGNTGNAADNDPPYKHCHFEVRAGATTKGLDPTAYIGFDNAVGTYGAEVTPTHTYDVTGLKMSEGDKDTICSMLDKLGIKYNIVTT